MEVDITLHPVQVILPDVHAVLPVFTRTPFHDSLFKTRATSGGVAFSVSTTKPFVASHSSFVDLLGPEPSVRVLAARPGTSFAHEAGVYVDGEIWFTSNLTPDGDTISVDVFTVNLKNGVVEKRNVGVKTGNGACPYGKRILFCDQGSLTTPSSLVLVDPETDTARILLNNYHGRQFTSLNDVTILPPPGQPCTFTTEVPEDSTVWFTDPPYGHEQGFRPSPQLPSSVYVFHPLTGELRVAADGLKHPNGIAFSPDSSRCYVTDTSHIKGCGTLDPALESTIYQFDVIWPTGGLADGLPSLGNRRVFAFVDCGVPDGIKCDKAGNVYSGCGDGIHIWNKHGRLLGRIVLGFSDGNIGAACANFCFCPGGSLVCFSEDRIYLVEGLAVEGALL